MRIHPSWLDLASVKKLEQLLEEVEHAVIFSHRNPDGDTIGGNIALRLALEAQGKCVTSVCADPLPHIYDIMPGCHVFQQDWDRSDVDMYMNVDGSSTTQLVFPEKEPSLLDGRVPFVSIDHHISNALFGTLNVVVPDACSTTFILYHLFCALRWNITPLMATYLLLGIYYDTGSFMHANTSFEALQAASELQSLGADRAMVMKVLYQQRTQGQLKIWGRALERMERTPDGVIVSGVTAKDLRECGAQTDEVGGVVDYLNSVGGTKFSVLLSEDPVKGIVKGSTRTRRDDVDLSEFCKKLGGGGHKKASGFGIPGSLGNQDIFHFDTESDVSFEF